MRIRRSYAMIAIAFVVAWVAALAAIWWRLRPANPELVRYLPDGQLIGYIDLEPLRAAGLLGKQDAALHSPSYAAFVQDSGFDFERDLDVIAISMRGNPAADHRSVALLEGHFSPRFSAYLRRQAQAVEALDGRPFYRFAPGTALSAHSLWIYPISTELMAISSAGRAPILKMLLERSHWRAPKGPTLWQQLGPAQPHHPLGFIAVDGSLFGPASAAEETPAWLPFLRGSRWGIASLSSRAGGVRLLLVDQANSAAAAGTLAAQARMALNAIGSASANAGGTGGLLELWRSLLTSARIRHSGALVRLETQIPWTGLQPLFAAADPAPAK